MAEQPVEADLLPAEDLAAAALTVARRFAAGGTMWCVSPMWPPHGRHVAVEFVHPVIMGKRALPAVHVEGPDLAGTLRMLTRAGDLLLAVGPAEAGLADLMARAGAWGLTSLWLGVGPRPAPPGADHVVWSSAAAVDRAAWSGEVVVLYHLLWELTHVVFEHPGLLADPADGAGEVCVTCSDEGRVAEIVALRSDARAEVLAGGRTEVVDVSLLDGVGPGDLILVHAGVGLTALAGGSG